MATQYDPIAKDASLNTTENPSRNLADVIAQSLASLIAAMPATVLNNLADVVITLPTDGQTLKYDSVSQKWVNADDAGGHTIEDASGTSLSQEPTLQFADADASDDAVNEKTVVNVVRKRTQAQYDAMSAADQAKGIIHITDANAKPLFDTQVRLSSGDGTVADALVPLSGTEVFVCAYVGSNEFDTGKYLSAIIPLPNADARTITLKSVVQAGQNTEYVAQCAVSLRSQIGFSVRTPSQLAGKSIYVKFDYE